MSALRKLAVFVGLWACRSGRRGLLTPRKKKWQNLRSLLDLKLSCRPRRWVLFQGARRRRMRAKCETSGVISAPAYLGARPTPSVLIIRAGKQGADRLAAAFSSADVSPNHKPWP